MDRRGVVTVKVVGVAIAAREKSITIASPDRFFVMKMIPSSTSTPTPTPSTCVTRGEGPYFDPQHLHVSVVAV